MKKVDEAVLIFEELMERCLFEDARIMATFITHSKACNVSYSDKEGFFTAKNYQAILRLPCGTALDHYFSLYSLYCNNKTMNCLVKQSVWIDKLLDQSESLMQICEDDVYLVYLRALVLIENQEIDNALSLLANCIWSVGKSNFLVWKLFALTVRSFDEFNSFTKDLECLMKSLSILYMGAKRQFYIPTSCIFSFSKANSNNSYIATLTAAFFANQNEDQRTESFISSVKNSPFFLDFADIFSHRYFCNLQVQELDSLAHRLVIKDFNYFIVYGNLYSLKNNHHESISCFKQASAIESNNPLPYLLMGFEYLAMDSNTDALECYYKAYRLEESDYRIIYALGYFYEKSGFYSRAIQFYSRLIKIRPFDGRFLIALAECHGYFEHNEDMLKYALEGYNLSQFPSHAKVVAQAYKQLDIPLKSIEYYSKCLISDQYKDYLRLEDLLYCVKMCIKHKSVTIGRQFLNCTATYTDKKLYAHELALLEEQLDSIWQLGAEGDSVCLPELSGFDSINNSIKSKAILEFTPSRFDPNISISFNKKL